MSIKHLYQVQFVRGNGGPKFHDEAGYSCAETDISAHRVAFGENAERHDEYPTATIFSNCHSDKTIISLEPLTESSKISGSDIIKQTYSMEALEKTLRMPLSLFEMADRIRTMPSPRKKLFQQIVAASGLSPNTVKMLLCPSSSFYPKDSVRRLIAKAMKGEVKDLFPGDRLQAGSIANVYSCLPSRNIDYLTFVDLLAHITRSSKQTVQKWLKTRRVPSKYAREAIAEFIGVSNLQLFPPCEED